MFSYLTGGLIEKACEHALAHQDYHLALLIAQATGSEDCKQMIRVQLAMWADTSVSLSATSLYFLTIVFWAEALVLHVRE